MAERMFGGAMDQAARLAAGERLLDGIADAIGARDFEAAVALTERLAIVCPPMAQGVLDAVELAAFLKEDDGG